jgi:hypothetical protein
MFIAFVKRSLSLPPKAFFHDLLALYGTQLHHLGPNSISWIFAFTVLYEGYLGIHPRMSLWCAMFHLKQQKNLAKSMHECDVEAITKRELDYILDPKLPTSVKIWQKPFFYIQDEPLPDEICLLA